MRLLIIEDDEKTARAIASGLENGGFSAVTAHTGEEGFFLLNAESFDLVVLDWMLPGREGIEILRTLRARGSKTPVLLLTARDAIDDRVLGLETGADDYLVKPFAFAELLARLRVMLRHRGSASPQAIPAVMTEEPKEAALKEPVGEPRPADAKENTGPSGEQLLEKYVQAVGGAAAIDKVTSRVMKGTIDFGGKSLPIDIYSKDPEKRVSFTHMPEGDSVTAFNGNEGWLGTPGRPLREMHGSDLDGASIDADLHLATHFKTMFSEVRVRGTEKVGDHQAYVVVGQREGKPPIRLYFDE